MFVRATRIQNSSDRVDDGLADYEQAAAQMRGMPGNAGAILMADRASGVGMSVTFWETEDALRASEQPTDGLRAQLAQSTGATVIDVDRFELVLNEGVAPPRAHTFVRGNDLKGSPDRVDATLQFVRERVVPLLKQQKGFVAVVMGANRQSGRMFVNSIWATAEDREASDAAVRESRREGAQAAGADQAETQLYEVLFAEVRLGAPVS